MAFVNGLWLAYHCPHRKGHHRPSHKGHLCPPHKGTVLMRKIVQFVNRLRPSNKWPVRQRVYSTCSYSTNYYVRARALFVNRDRQATSGHVHEWDIVAPCFVRQHRELSLASSAVNAGTYTSIHF